MGKIGDMGARAADHFGAMGDEAVELAGQRGDFGGELTLEAPGAALADPDERLADAPERHQADAHLNRDGRDQPEAERGERPEQRTVEACDVGFGLGHVARDREAVGFRVFAALCGPRQRDAPHEHAQALIVRAVGVAPERIVGAGRQLRGRENLVPERTRSLGLNIARLRSIGLDLPIPAGEHPLEARVGEAPFVQGHMFRRVLLGCRHQAIEIEAQAVVHALLHGAAENTRQHEAPGNEAKNAPYGRAHDQPERQRIRPRNGARQLVSPTALGSSRR